MLGLGLLYFAIIVIANTVGSVSGMGGGVIIKPVLDTLGAHSLAAVSFYSSTAVLMMSCVSTLRQSQQGAQFNKNLLFLVAVGAWLGGAMGNIGLDLLMEAAGDNFAQTCQIILTIATLLFALLYTHGQWRCWELRDARWQVVCGLILGFCASFLGIGGGPINVALIMLWFGMPIKQATIYSIAIIFLSQLSKMVTLALTTGFGRFDLTMLIFVIPAGIIGGLAGVFIHKLASTKRITEIFQLVIIGVIMLNLYNWFCIYL